jgi:hypothetical protein
LVVAAEEGQLRGAISPIKLDRAGYAWSMVWIPWTP